MKIYDFSFDTRNSAIAAQRKLKDSGFDAGTSQEGFVVVLSERKNPDWEFTASLLRFLRWTFNAHGLRDIHTREQE